MQDKTTRRASSLSMLMPGAIEQSTHDRIRQLPVTSVFPNPYQVRTEFDDESISELANSINENGLLEPVIVRQRLGANENNQGFATYELIAGERRWRAYQKLKKPSIPAIVRPTKDEDMKLLALLENVQREDLSMMEKVRAVGELKERLGNVDAVAAKLGWSRRTGFIYSRIGESDSFYQEIIQKQGLDLRKAEALLSAVDRLKKSGDKNALESFNNELKAGSNSVFDSIERFSPSTQANSTGKKKVGGKSSPKSGYWQTNQEYGISLSVKKGKVMIKKDQESIVHQLTKFAEAIGAKKIDIRF